MKIVIDIEADGLLIAAKNVWCVVIQNLDDGNIDTFRPEDEDFAVTISEYFNDAEAIIGHNIMMYDLPLLKKLYGINYNPSKVIDTQLISRVLEPDRENGHSLKAWGIRLGNVKSDFTDFTKYTEEMLEYCIQDVKVTSSLYKFITSDINLSDKYITLEHEFAYIISQQILAGFGFDVEGAEKLYSELVIEYDNIKSELASIMPKIANKNHYNTVVKKNALISENSESYTYSAGGKVKTKEFTYIEPNPTSRQQLAAWLISKGWKPKSFTETGLPEVNEKTLADFATIESTKAVRMLRLQKQLGMLKDGQSGWIKCYHQQGTGRIHGDVITNGANTGRCTHSNPNVSQVDKKDLRMRALWIPREQWHLVGIDAASLELRVLAHYLSYYDDGLFATLVSTGDVHTHNQQTFGLQKRDSAKTMIYALIYGAGDKKLGTIAMSDIGVVERDEAKLIKAGRVLRQRVIDDFSGYKELLEDVKNIFKSRGFLVGLDKRPLHPRKEYSALNLLIQSGGAIIMKQAQVNSLKLFKDNNLQLGIDYNYVGSIHDEAQIEVKANPDLIGELFVRAIENTKQDFNLKCDMAGEYKVGKNWSLTH